MNSQLKTQNPDAAVGQLVQFRLFGLRPLWRLGPGWAALAGLLSSGFFRLEPAHLLTLVLVWLIADPLLGTVWSLGTGNGQPRGAAPTGGIWHWLREADFPDRAQPIVLLPYTQPHSPAGRLAQRLGRFCCWWRENFAPQAGAEFWALALGAILAAALGTLLGLRVLALVLLVIALSWLYTATRPRSRGPWGAALRALAEFGLPWLIGCFALGGVSWLGVALGMCYTIAYFGLVYQAHRFRWLGSGQLAAAALLTGLHLPFAAAWITLFLIVQFGLHVWTDYARGGAPYLTAVQPFVLAGILLAALTIP